jgi:hypothetical protein
MKVALIMSGEIREGLETFPSLKKHIIDVVKPDIYLHTYNDDTFIPYINNLTHKNLKYKPKVIFQAITSLKDDEFEGLERMFLDELKGKRVSGQPCVSGDGAFYMWRNWSKLFDMFKSELVDKNQYDIIIRTRPDCAFSEDLNLSDLDLKTMNIPTGGDWCGGCHDMFCVANRLDMEYYCKLYKELKSYISDSDFGWHAETILKKHLRKRFDTINRFVFPVSLRGNQHTHGTKTNPVPDAQNESNSC